MKWCIFNWLPLEFVTFVSVLFAFCGATVWNAIIKIMSKTSLISLGSNIQTKKWFSMQIFSTVTFDACEWYHRLSEKKIACSDRHSQSTSFVCICKRNRKYSDCLIVYDYAAHFFFAQHFSDSLDFMTRHSNACN